MAGSKALTQALRAMKRARDNAVKLSRHLGRERRDPEYRDVTGGLPSMAPADSGNLPAGMTGSSLT
jgi:hypothetical protein